MGGSSTSTGTGRDSKVRVGTDKVGRTFIITGITNCIDAVAVAVITADGDGGDATEISFLTTAGSGVGMGGAGGYHATGIWDGDACLDGFSVFDSVCVCNNNI